MSFTRYGYWDIAPPWPLLEIPKSGKNIVLKDLSLSVTNKILVTSFTKIDHETSEPAAELFMRTFDALPCRRARGLRAARNTQITFSVKGLPERAGGRVKNRPRYRDKAATAAQRVLQGFYLQYLVGTARLMYQSWYNEVMAVRGRRPTTQPLLKTKQIRERARHLPALTSALSAVSDFAVRHVPKAHTPITFRINMNNLSRWRFDRAHKLLFPRANRRPPKALSAARCELRSERPATRIRQSLPIQKKNLVACKVGIRAKVLRDNDFEW
ncbi:hypothetical protein EVAR_55362_1 [Eumeta japonica]|uniref:Uncharacterized protein n=1 Tax=Eumeta variegata TaxID=151549 RepID=A0A4C1YWU9_EUMVA|nr:hypothetical protein EVAR_55362_1 [Eumeta japonica]